MILYESRIFALIFAWLPEWSYIEIDWYSKDGCIIYGVWNRNSMWIIINIMINILSGINHFDGWLMI